MTAPEEPEIGPLEIPAVRRYAERMSEEVANNPEYLDASWQEVLAAIGGLPVGTESDVARWERGAYHDEGRAAPGYYS